MEAGSTSAAADGYPRWVLLERSTRCEDPDGGRTVAFALTSRGHPFGVSFRLAPPPAMSGLCLHRGADLPDGVNFAPRVVAAHGDSVLINIVTQERISRYSRMHQASTIDFFVYCAGDAASRLPSLSLLPPSYHGLHDRRYMDVNATALLRRCGEELLVAELLAVKGGAESNEEEDPVEAEAELWMFRSGEWEVKRLPVSHDEGKRHELSLWQAGTVVPVGDRFLCWVDLNRGVILADMSEDTPELRYVSLPVKPILSPQSYNDRRRRSFSMSVCATSGDGGGAVVRFVDVSPRCCCGSPGSTTCARSRKAFTVTTWTLRTDAMAWHKDGVLDSDELWGLAGYVHGVVPRIPPELPTVSLDDPGVLYLLVRKHPFHAEDDVAGDEVHRHMEVDMRRKELRSIFSYDDPRYSQASFVPSKLSSYFNTNTYSGRPASKLPEAIQILKSHPYHISSIH